MSYPQEPTVRLDRERLDAELARRGLTGRQLAKLTGYHEQTISRARLGYPVLVSVLRRMAEVLDQVPPALNETALRLLALTPASPLEPETTNATADKTVAFREAGDATAAAPVRG